MGVACIATLQLIAHNMHYQPESYLINRVSQLQKETQRSDPRYQDPIRIQKTWKVDSIDIKCDGSEYNWMQRDENEAKFTGWVDFAYEIKWGMGSKTRKCWYPVISPFLIVLSLKFVTILSFSLKVYNKQNVHNRANLQHQTYRYPPPDMQHFVIIRLVFN